MPDNRQAKFLTIIEANQRLIFKICNSYCNHSDDREDLAQEMVFQLWKSWETYNGSVKLQTWMYRILLNVAISFYRRTKRDIDTVNLDEHLFEVAEESADSETADRIDKLQHYISELKPLDKALMLLYLEEKSHREIAEIMGITSTNVATKVGRIKEQLKQKLNRKL